MRAERDELAVAVRVWQRVSEELADERAAAGSPVMQVAGRAVRLVPDRAPGVDESALPAEYQRILAAVRQAAGPVATRQIGEVLGLDAALTLPYSKGPTEDVNTKIKLIARQMHDRAGFTLLRHRILLG